VLVWRETPLHQSGSTKDSGGEPLLWQWEESGG
jgi:hypothetical protein